MEKIFQPNVNEKNNINNLELEEKNAKENIAHVFSLYPELASIGSQQEYAEYLKTIMDGVTGDQIVWHGGNIQDENQINTEKGIYFTQSKDYATEFLAINQKATKIYPALLKIHNPTEINYLNSEIISILINIRKDNPLNLDHYNGIHKKFAEKLLASPELMQQIKNADSFIGQDLYDDSWGPNIYSYGNSPELFYKLKNLSENTINYVLFSPNQIHLLGSNMDQEKFKQFVETIHQAD